MTGAEIIPKQILGGSTDTVSKIKMETIDEALWEFEIVKDRLLNVSQWHELTADIFAKFQLMDEAGNEFIQNSKGR